MVAPFVADLRLSLSQERLDTYRPSGGSDLEMLTNYFWNIELAEALVPSMHAVEVALRNTLHATLSTHYANDMWFYEDEVLEPYQLRDFATALGKVSKKSKPWPGRIVAELNFGFWASLLNAPYEQRIWRPTNYALLFTAFPGAVGMSRKQVSDRFTAIKDLRNRVFHHEPIWYRPSLGQEHADTLEAVEWISPTLYKAIQAVDNFRTTLGARADVENALKVHLGIP